MKAYFTVEAALILPVVLGIYSLLIWSMLFLHDRCLAEQEIALLAMRGVMAYEENGEDGIKEINRKVSQMDNDRFLNFQYDDIKLQAVGGKLTVEGAGKTKASLGSMGKWGEGSRGVIYSAYTNRKLSPVMMIRLCRRIIERDQEG